VSPAFTIGIIPLIFYYAAQQRFFTVSFCLQSRCCIFSRFVFSRTMAAPWNR
jgi:hypothetical protein